jgi:molybdopterin-guanine dinucleotide biosynthesis protein A
VNSTLVGLFQEQLGDHDAVVFKDGERYLPLPGLYRTSTHEIAVRRLAGEDRSLSGFLDKIDTAALDDTWLSKHPEYHSCIQDMDTLEAYHRNLLRQPG